MSKTAFALIVSFIIIEYAISLRLNDMLYIPITLLKPMSSSRWSLRNRRQVDFFMEIVRGKQEKPGTGDNGMTNTGFTIPFVEKVLLPGTLQGFEWKVKQSLLDQKKMSIPEKTKMAKSPLALLDEIEMLAEEAREAERIQREMGIPASICTSHETRLKWLGLFHRGKIAPSTYMWRFRIANGIMTSSQVKALAEVIQEYDTGSRDMWERTGCADVTTRMNMQLRGIRLDRLPDHWRKLQSVGIFSLQESIRAGRSTLALIALNSRKNLLMLAEAMQSRSNLSLNYSLTLLSGMTFLFNAVGPGGEAGWDIGVGGVLSSTLCEFAVPLDAWVPLENHWALGDAVLTTFRDYGFRYKPRGRCRLMFLINDMGLEAFRAEVAQRYTLGTGMPLLRSPNSVAANALNNLSSQKGGHSTFNGELGHGRDLLGLHEQSDGKCWLGLHIPAGRLYAEELLALSEFSTSYGNGEIRLTVDQNILIPGVDHSRVHNILEMARKVLPRLKSDPQGIGRWTVACTGNQWCGFAVINTKGSSLRLAEALDKRLVIKNAVRIHWTGCTNTCAQAQVGDIGLVGTKGKNSKGEVVECVDVFVGGGIGRQAKLAECIAERVPVDEDLEDLLAMVLIERFGAVPRLDECNSIGPNVAIADEQLKDVLIPSKKIKSIVFTNSSKTEFYHHDSEDKKADQLISKIFDIPWQLKKVKTLAFERLGWSNSTEGDFLP